MHNTYSPWAELASLPHLELRRERPAIGRLGEYLHNAGRFGRGLIRLHPEMPRRQARSVLCHELRHHEAGDVATVCAQAAVRQELLADITAARLLVDIRDLGDALVLHDQHRSAAAVELRVSDEVVHTRLKRLHPSERHYLIRRMAEL